MGEILSSVVSAAKAVITPDAVGGADWSGLQEDLLLAIMAELDIRGLVRSGAVCTSWHAAYATFRRLRLPSPKQAPCLLYACDEYGPNHVVLHCPSTNATFRVPFPGPPHQSRGFVFSSRGGWVFTTDEVGDPYLLNPITGVQVALPPVRTIYDYEHFYDDDGKHVWPADPENGSPRATINWARHTAYARVAVSTADEVTACTVLLVHKPGWMLSFARPGDKRWTLLSRVEPLVHRYFYDVLYNDKDAMFYALRRDGSVYTFDLNGPSPAVTMILPPPMTMTSRISLHNSHRVSMYLALATSGELLQVWRFWNVLHAQLMPRLLTGTLQNDGNELEMDAEEDGDLENPTNTIDFLIFKVDMDRQTLVELRGIEDDTLFLGLNSAVCLPTKDFPALEPNCAYLTDDFDFYFRKLRRDLGIWSFKEKSLRNIGDDAWPDLHLWLDLPAPIWITPSLC